MAAVLRRHPWLVAALAGACLLVASLGLRLAERARHWPDPDAIVIESWMTLGLVERASGVDRRLLAAELGLGPDPGSRFTLDAIAVRTGRSVPDVAALLSARIAAERGGAAVDQ